jgi:hypothetical protein
MKLGSDSLMSLVFSEKSKSKLQLSVKKPLLLEWLNIGRLAILVHYISFPSLSAPESFPFSNINRKVT